MGLVELVWDRKYDDSGKKSAPVSIALPFQTIETVNESSQQRQKSIQSFLTGQGDNEWRNRLIWGDKKYVLPSLLPEFANSVDLIYIDPPFDTGADFSYRVEVPDHEVETSSFTKLPSVIEQKAYRDTWGQGASQLDSYLRWINETLVFLDKLLKPTGSIYVHLDWHVSHHVKIIMDEIFGNENFRNSITWVKSTNPKGSQYDMTRYHSFTDTILYYSKSRDATLNLDAIRQPLSPKELGQKYDRRDEKGPFTDGPIESSPSMGPRPTLVYEYKGYTPGPPGWRLKRELLEKLDAAGDLGWTSNGKPYRKIRPESDKGDPIGDFWDDISLLNSQSLERVGYPTQKPTALIDRIVKCSSNDSDLVLDCFVGSGTTAVVAEQLNRRWIACDLSRFAVQTTRKRLLNVPNVRPFVIQNLGKYERQVWQTAEFGSDTTTKIRSYVNFILNLYSAQSLNGYIWLHGIKGKRMIHVGAVDSPVSPVDVGQIVAEFKRSIGRGEHAPKTTGVDILGWDFAFELNELAKQQAAQAGVDIRFLRIPIEVLDKRAVEQGDVRFFELASLNVEIQESRRKVTIGIKDFVIPVDDVPADVQKGIKHWSQWIDYWAVDWDYRNDTFHNEWQEYRTRNKPDLSVESSKTYDHPGKYQVVVKVIDLLGNDTTKSMKVDVA
jgi:DNA modification methylase